MNYFEISQWLKTLVERYFRVDQWSINNPAHIESGQHPPSAGLVVPVVIKSESPQVTGMEYKATANPTHEYQIIYRFPSLLRYEDIPHAEIAALLLSVKLKMELEIRCELGPTAANPPSVDLSYSVYREENKDWLVLIKVVMVLSLLLERDEVKFTSPYFSPV
jgi:hypothetical protein